MQLPNLAKAWIDPAKLNAYVLNPGHPEGRHKARVFLASLGVSAVDAPWLGKAILDALPSADAQLQSSTAWGSLYRVDVPIQRGQRCAMIRTAWLCTNDEARLVTCFVVGGCDEAV